MNDGGNIAIDIRSLLEPKRTGVGENTFELLDALFKIDKQNQYFLFLNSSRKGTDILPDWKQDNVTMLKFNFPNRLFNLFLWLFGRPKLDKLILKKIKIILLVRAQSEFFGFEQRRKANPHYP